MKKYFYLTLVLGTAIGAAITLTAFNSPQSEGDFMFVRVFETSQTGNASKIIITDGVKTTVDIVQLEAVRPPHHPQNIDNAKRVVAALNKLKQEGYSIVSVSGSGHSFGSISDYVLEKK